MHTAMGPHSASERGEHACMHGYMHARSHHTHLHEPEQHIGVDGALMRLVKDDGAVPAWSSMRCRTACVGMTAQFRVQSICMEHRMWCNMRTAVYTGTHRVGLCVALASMHPCASSRTIMPGMHGAGCSMHTAHQDVARCILHEAYV